MTGMKRHSTEFKNAVATSVTVAYDVLLTYST